MPQGIPRGWQSSDRTRDSGDVNYLALIQDITAYLKGNSSVRDPGDIATEAVEQVIIQQARTGNVRSIRRIAFQRAKTLAKEQHEDERRVALGDAALFEAQDQQNDKTDTTLKPILDACDHDVLMEAISRLRDVERAVIVSRLQERTYSEIIRQTGLTEANARKVYSRAVERLREILQEIILGG